MNVAHCTRIILANYIKSECKKHVNDLNTQQSSRSRGILARKKARGTLCDALKTLLTLAFQSKDCILGEH